MEQLAADTVNDSVNGRWSGWVYFSDITERDEFESRVTMGFMTIDEDSISLFRNHTDPVALEVFDMSWLNFPCD